ncbi:MAG: NAD(P)-binding domain-containing protein, partial [Spirochaetota bacterium]
MTQSLKSITVGCIGLGNMGFAIVKGLLKNMPGDNIFGFDIDEEKTTRLAASGIQPVTTLAEMTG